LLAARHITNGLLLIQIAQVPTAFRNACLKVLTRNAAFFYAISCAAPYLASLSAVGFCGGDDGVN
jgi:hypothetical protein